MTRGGGRSVILLVVLAGCGGPKAAERFLPPPEKARQALDAALAAWQRGEPHGAVAGTSPPVQFVDSQHKPSQRLQAYSILSLAPGDGPRVYTVKLTLENPAGEVRARYVVIGLDPLWVIRHEDFEMLAHWDHPMKP